MTTIFTVQVKYSSGFSNFHLDVLILYSICIKRDRYKYYIFSGHHYKTITIGT